MSTIKYIGLALIISLTAACTQQPLVQLETQEPQRKILVAKHWRALADRVVTNLLCRSAQPCTSEQAATPENQALPSDRPLYIAEAAPDMVFSDTFRLYLKQSLLERGFQVSKSPQNADVLRFRAQTLWYDHRSGEHFPFDKATFWTTLGALGWAAGDGGLSKSQGVAGLLVAGPVIDFLRSLYDVTTAEVVITAFVEDERAISFIYTEEFYVNPGDLRLYYTDYPVVPMGEHGLMLADSPRPRVIHTAAR